MHIAAARSVVHASQTPATRQEPASHISFGLGRLFRRCAVMFVPTVENIEAYLRHVEEIVVGSLSQAVPDVPSVRQVFQRLHEDIARFWPQSLSQLPDIRLPNLGPFQVPPPPPPPPPPRSFFERSADWVSAHPWKTTGIGLGIVGAGLLVGYGGIYSTGSLRTRRYKTTGVVHDGERRQVVGEFG